MNDRLQFLTSEAEVAALEAAHPERQRQIAAMGGRSQGRRNNPGNFANNPERAAAAGRKGGRA